MRTPRQVIPVHPRRPTLTLLTARQWFAPSVECFDLPAYVAGGLRSLRGHRLRKLSRKDPVKVALWGDQLEEPPVTWDFLHLPQDPLRQSGCRPLAILQMAIPRLFAQPPHTGALPGGEEDALAAVNQLQVCCRRLPAVTQNRVRLAGLKVEGVNAHLLKVVVRGLALYGRDIPPISNRIKVPIFSATMH